MKIPRWTLYAGAAAAGLAAFALVSRKRPDAPWRNVRLAPQNQPLALPPGMNESDYRRIVERALGPQVSFGGEYQAKPGEDPALRSIYAYQLKVWNGRASAFFQQYGRGREAAGLFRAGPWFKVIIPSRSGWTAAQLNRYGQGPQGFSGGPDILAIISTAGNYTLPNVPGIGSAANFALQGSIALGRGQSLEDAALAAARGALPPWGQIAFDMAVGLAKGKDVDDVAVQAGLAALEQKYPGARQAFNDGKAAAAKAGL